MFIAVRKNDAWSMFGLGPFALDKAIKTTISARGSFWRLTFLKEGDNAPGEMCPGHFSRQSQ